MNSKFDCKYKLFLRIMRFVIEATGNSIMYWLNYIAKHGLGYRLGFGLQTRWLHCTIKKLPIAWTGTWIPNLTATLYYAETIRIAQTQTWILVPNRYCTHFWEGYRYPDRDHGLFRHNLCGTGTGTRTDTMPKYRTHLSSHISCSVKV